MLTAYRVRQGAHPALLLDRRRSGYRGVSAETGHAFVSDGFGAAPARPRARWEDVDPDVLTTLGEEITTLFARLSAMTQRLLALLEEFDRLEGWRREGYASCADWLAHRAGIDRGTAREKVRVARALARLPETSAAMARGELSFSQVRAMSRVADAECELELLGHAKAMTAGKLERLVRSWKRLGRDDEVKQEQRRHRSRTLSVFPDDEGMYVIRGRLEPETGALLMRAIEAASDAMYKGSVPETTPEQRRADALRLLAERGLAAGFAGTRGSAMNAGLAGTRGTRAVSTVEGSHSECSSHDCGTCEDADGERTHDVATACECGGAHLLPNERYTVVLHVDDVTLAGAGETGRSELEDGTRVSAETSRRIACDAGLVRVASRGGAREVSGKTRTVPPRLRRALEIRDRGCRFPGCGARFTDAHHVRHWADGGPTRLDNLVLLCRIHHRLLHEGGFRLTADPDRGRLIFYSPKGVPIPEVPPKVTLGDPALPRRAKLDVQAEATAVAAAPRWDQDVPLALYLRAMASIG